MAKDKAKPAAEDAEADPDAPKPEGEGGEEQKQGFVKKLLGNKMMLMIVAGGLLLVLGGGGAGAYFFLFSGSKTAAGAKVAAGGAPPAPIVPPTVAFYDMPDIVVNIQSADATTPAYLKLSVALELTGADEKAGIGPLMPRVVDQFQGYLRELRVDDLKGSAGVMRLKEELLRRINTATAPFKIKDVLLKEMIVQ